MTNTLPSKHCFSFVGILKAIQRAQIISRNECKTDKCHVLIVRGKLVASLGNASELWSTQRIVSYNITKDSCNNQKLVLQLERCKML